MHLRSLILGLFIVGGAASAQTALTGIAPSASTGIERHQTAQQQTRADYSAWQQYDRSQWDLTEDDWSRYEEIMHGPRGAWSPNLDPLTALMVEARSDDERARFAEKLVMQEEQRTRKDLDGVRAYTAAWQRLFPNAPFFDEARLAGDSANTPENKPFSPGDRVAFFVNTQCVACRTIIDQIAKNIDGLMYPGLDVYVVQATPDDVQKWAKDTKLRVDLINRGVMTLNVDDNLLARLQKTDKPQSPAAYRRRGDEFVPIEMSALGKADLYPKRLAPTGTSAGLFHGLFNSVMGKVSPVSDGAGGL